MSRDGASDDQGRQPDRVCVRLAQPNELARGLRSSGDALPASKSHVQRALLLAALGRAGGDNVTTLRAVQGAGDGGMTEAFAVDLDVARRALETLGARITSAGRDWRVAAAPVPSADREERLQPLQVECAQNGTMARTLGVLLAMRGENFVLDGASGLRRRPMDALVDSLRRAGFRVVGRRLPLAIDGRERRARTGVMREIVVDAATTTQVASGWLIAFGIEVLADGETRRVVAERPRARGYLDLTVAVLATFGVEAEVQDEADRLVFVLRRGCPAHGPAEVLIPADPSAWAFPAALAAMHGQPRPDAPVAEHPDARMAQDLEALLRTPADSICVLAGLGSRPDTFPALVACAATRDCTTRVEGAPQLRVKESDRIAAMAALLRSAGMRADPRPDGLVVFGPLPRGDAHSIELVTVDDHRIVMAAALLATARPGGGIIAHARSVAKSWPGFWTWLVGCGVAVEPCPRR